MPASVCGRGHDLTLPGNRRTDQSGCRVCHRVANMRAVQRYRHTPKGRTTTIIADTKSYANRKLRDHGIIA